jgi:hypothetical protein
MPKVQRLIGIWRSELDNHPQRTPVRHADKFNAAIGQFLRKRVRVGINNGSRQFPLINKKVQIPPRTFHPNAAVNTPDFILQFRGNNRRILLHDFRQSETGKRVIPQFVRRRNSNIFFYLRFRKMFL